MLGTVMFTLERLISNVLQMVRLDRIRGKVLVFAMLATLIPSLTLGWQSYGLNKRFITEKISEEVQNATFQVVRELDLWLKERLYEMRVFSSSYEVVENIDRIHAAGAAARPADARPRLTQYLQSVQAKFVDYEELLVIASDGAVLATSAERADPSHLPLDWLRQAVADSVVVGQIYFDEGRKKPAMKIAVPIRTPGGKLLGAMAATLNLGTVERILGRIAVQEGGKAYLVREDGTVIVSSSPMPAPFPQTRLTGQSAGALFEGEAIAVEYADYGGRPVRGTLRRVPQLGWGAVADVGNHEAYAQTNRIWARTLFLVGALLAGISGTAYLLELTIVRPLDRLTAGATRVSAGDLDVQVPVVDRSEVGYLTSVFNHMVTRLREARDALAARNQELQELSITDGLTGLHNHKHLIETLEAEVARARRLQHQFSILMIDLDHFKGYNDTYGHLAGDQVLTRVSALFRETIRSIDYAARYGGEEFLLLLYEVGMDGALRAAERVRQRVAGEKFGEGPPVAVTVSIGVAEFPSHGETALGLIAAADAALYEAKRSGRNRVVQATSPTVPSEHPA
ncbi:MAG TPA: diguanylate cyclase [Methylomirabilota bacterium]|nr:diguanylate cyclase [Methylomirabilota bacterium]